MNREIASISKSLKILRAFFRGAYQLPKCPENRSTTTPLVGKPGLLVSAVDLEKSFVTQKKKKKKKNEKLPKPRGTYPLYLEVNPNDSAQGCSNEERRRALGDRPADRPSYICEGSDVLCLLLKKVHQPQVPGLRCHCQQGECPKSF